MTGRSPAALARLSYTKARARAWAARFSARVSMAPPGGTRRGVKSLPASSMRHPCRHAFIDEAAFAEPLQPEGIGQRRRALGHQFGHRPPGPGDGLEPAGAPAAIDEHVVDRGFRDNG